MERELKASHYVKRSDLIDKLRVPHHFRKQQSYVYTWEIRPGPSWPIGGSSFSLSQIPPSPRLYTSNEPVTARSISISDRRSLSLCRPGLVRVVARVHRPGDPGKSWSTPPPRLALSRWWLLTFFISFFFISKLGMSIPMIKTSQHQRER